LLMLKGPFFKNDKWLIIKRSEKEEHAGGLLSLVGGKVEMEGNSTDILERTVKREILEEVGIVVKENLKYVLSTSFVADSGENVIDIVFLCEYASGEPFAKSPDEVETVKWLTCSEIINDPKVPSFLKESIKHAEALK
jgi:8-oxo-dGTP diphosphatase